MSVPKLPPSTSQASQHWGEALPSGEGKEKQGWDSTGSPGKEQSPGADPGDPDGAAARGALPGVGMDPPAVPAPWVPPGLGGTSPLPVHNDAKHLGMRPLD